MDQESTPDVPLDLVSQFVRQHGLDLVAGELRDERVDRVAEKKLASQW
jgi:hypothetical protein